MSKPKKIDISCLTQLGCLPTIPMPLMIPCEQVQRINNIQPKQSDFIKRIKRTKSIMLAHKNRKQKNMLSAYFTQSPKKINKYFTPISQSNGSLKKETETKTRDTILMEQKLEKLLFPPVHSSMPIDFKYNKKTRGKYKSLKIEFADPKTQRDFNKIKDRLLAVIKQRDQYEQLKKNPEIIKQQSQRQRINLTQQKSNYIRGEVLYSFSPRTQFAQKNKNKNKIIKIFKSFTEQSENIKNHEDIDRWQFRKAEDEHEFVIKENF